MDNMLEDLSLALDKASKNHEDSLQAALDFLLKHHGRRICRIRSQLVQIVVKRGLERNLSIQEIANNARISERQVYNILKKL